MNIVEDRAAGVVTLALSGRLDHTSATELEGWLVRLIDGGDRRVIMDLFALEYTNSVGLRVFLLAAKRLEPLGGRLVLCRARDVVRQTLDIAEFGKIFLISDSLEAARAAFA